MAEHHSKKSLFLYFLRFVFGVTALLPLLTSAVAVLVDEQRVLSSARAQIVGSPSFLESSKQNIVELWGAVRQPHVFLPTIFIFLWQATPQSDSAMFYFTYAQFSFVIHYLAFCITTCCVTIRFCFFKLLLECAPICDTNFFSSTNKLGFTPEFLGRVKLVTSVASLLGVGLYNGFLKNVSLQKIFLVTTISGTALGMTQVCDCLVYCLAIKDCV